MAKKLLGLLRKIGHKLKILRRRLRRNLIKVHFPATSAMSATNLFSNLVDTREKMYLISAPFCSREDGQQDSSDTSHMSKVLLTSNSPRKKDFLFPRLNDTLT